jgi:hypothetical protein
MKICPVCRQENGSMYVNCVNCGTDISNVKDVMAQPIDINQIKIKQAPKKGEKPVSNAPLSHLKIFVLCAAILASLAFFMNSIMFQWDLTFTIIGFIMMIVGTSIMLYPTMFKSGRKSKATRMVLRVFGFIFIIAACGMFVGSLIRT